MNVPKLTVIYPSGTYSGLSIPTTRSHFSPAIVVVGTSAGVVCFREVVVVISPGEVEGVCAEVTCSVEMMIGQQNLFQCTKMLEIPKRVL